MTALHTNLNWTLAMNDTARVLAKRKYLSMFAYHGMIASWIHKHPQAIHHEATLVLESLLRDHGTNTIYVGMTPETQRRYNLCEDLERKIIDIIAKEDFNDAS